MVRDPYKNPYSPLKGTLKGNLKRTLTGTLKGTLKWTVKGCRSDWAAWNVATLARTAAATGPTSSGSV